MNKELGHGAYQPSVFAFFPKLGRGHAGRNCMACKTGDSKNHSGQKQNREDWEESVGISPAKSKTTRQASHGMRTAQRTTIDPKGLAAIVAVTADFLRGLPAR